MTEERPSSRSIASAHGRDPTDIVDDITRILEQGWGAIRIFHALYDTVLQEPVPLRLLTLVTRARRSDKLWSSKP